MTGNKSSLELKWTAGIEATLFQETEFLWLGLFSAMDQALSGHAPVYRILKGENRFSVYFGVDGDTSEIAEHTSKTLIVQAIGSIGLEWVSIECLSVCANEVIDQDIARIDNFGHLRPEADIIPFATHTNDE